MKRFALRSLALAALTVLGAGVQAQTTSLVNFDPDQGFAQGPSIFVAVPAAQTFVTTPATFSGGVILGLATFFPAIQFATGPNVYGTADFGNGLKNLLSIDVSPSFTTTQVSFALFNGETFNQDYLVKAYDVGGSLIQTSNTGMIVPNWSSGYTLVDVNPGVNLSRVTIESNLASTHTTAFDFLIDSISFNQSVSTALHLPPPPVYTPSNPPPVTLPPVDIETVEKVETEVVNPEYERAEQEVEVENEKIRERNRKRKGKDPEAEDEDLLTVDPSIPRTITVETEVRHKQKGKIVNFGDDLLDVRGNFIDAPLMAPVPEPSTWALMLLGLVGVTGWARRKAQQA